ncbi:hypothetical protein P8452_71944 [Trifolium repens]|nr:hypothetical protein P8452_71944 [Trifolium repens]
MSYDRAGSTFREVDWKRDGTSVAPDTYAPFVPSATQQPPATVVPTAPPPPPPPPTPPPPRYPSRDLCLSPRVSHNQGEVCKLKKALYGLKQAPRAW